MCQTYFLQDMKYSFSELVYKLSFQSINYVDKYKYSIDLENLASNKLARV